MGGAGCCESLGQEVGGIWVQAGMHVSTSGEQGRNRPVESFLHVLQWRGVDAHMDAVIRHSTRHRQASNQLASASGGTPGGLSLALARAQVCGYCALALHLLSRDVWIGGVVAGAAFVPRCGVRGGAWSNGVPLPLTMAPLELLICPSLRRAG